MTRQRTLILTRIESSDWGRRDTLLRRTDNVRYWALVPFYPYVWLLGSALYIARAAVSHGARRIRSAIALSKALYPEVWDEGRGPS